MVDLLILALGNGVERHPQAEVTQRSSFYFFFCHMAGDLVAVTKIFILSPFSLVKVVQMSDVITDLDAKRLEFK